MRILLISPHADDAELGAGASISRFIEEGYEVTVYLLITKEKFPVNFPIKDRIAEFQASMKVLGVQDYRMENYPVRELYKYRQEVLEKLIALREELNPDMVFLPSLSDIHQDHQVAAMEGYRAFNRRARILSYELAWNTTRFAPNYYIRVDEEDVKKKIEALSKYESQKLLNRKYLNPEFLRAQLIFRGVQCNSEYAEAFEVLHWQY